MTNMNTVLAKKKVVREGSAYLYQQVVDILRKEINTFTPDQKFYTDREICKLFQVSQATARQALAILTQEGSIRRVSAKGTYVQKRRSPVHTKHLSIGVVSLLGQDRPHSGAVHGIESAAAEWECSVHFSDFGNIPMDAEEQCEQLPDLVKGLMERKVDGIIIVSPIKRSEERLPAYLKNTDIPCVLINWLTREERNVVVAADYEDAEYRVTAHLIGHGYKTIGYVGGIAGRQSNRDRYTGYCRALADKGLTYCPEYVMPENPTTHEDSGYACAKRMMAAGSVPRAIVAATDYLAWGLIEAFKEKKIRVPEDVAVTGFDDNPLAARIKPPLTTAAEPYYELGRHAMNMLRTEMEGRQRSPAVVLVPCELVIRKSCGCT